MVLYCIIVSSSSTRPTVNVRSVSSYFKKSSGHPTLSVAMNVIQQHLLLSLQQQQLPQRYATVKILTPLIRLKRTFVNAQSQNQRRLKNQNLLDRRQKPVAVAMMIVTAMIATGSKKLIIFIHDIIF